MVAESFFPKLFSSILERAFHVQDELRLGPLKDMLGIIDMSVCLHPYVSVYIYTHTQICVYLNNTHIYMCVSLCVDRY